MPAVRTVDYSQHDETNQCHWEAGPRHGSLAPIQAESVRRIVSGGCQPLIHLSFWFNFFYVKAFRCNVAVLFAQPAHPLFITSRFTPPNLLEEVLASLFLQKACSIAWNLSGIMALSRQSTIEKLDYPPMSSPLVAPCLLLCGLGTNLGCGPGLLEDEAVSTTLREWCRLGVVNHFVSEDIADMGRVNVRASWQYATSTFSIVLKLERLSMWQRAMILDPFSVGQRGKTGESDTQAHGFHGPWRTRAVSMVPQCKLTICLAGPLWFARQANTCRHCPLAN